MPGILQYLNSEILFIKTFSIHVLQSLYGKSKLFIATNYNYLYTVNDTLKCINVYKRALSKKTIVIGFFELVNPVF